VNRIVFLRKAGDFQARIIFHEPGENHQLGGDAGCAFPREIGVLHDLV